MPPSHAAGPLARPLFALCRAFARDAACRGWPALALAAILAFAVDGACAPAAAATLAASAGPFAAPGLYAPSGQGMGLRPRSTLRLGPLMLGGEPADGFPGAGWGLATVVLRGARAVAARHPLTAVLLQTVTDQTALDARSSSLTVVAGGAAGGLQAVALTLRPRHVRFVVLSLP